MTQTSIDRSTDALPRRARGHRRIRNRLAWAGELVARDRSGERYVPLGAALFIVTACVVFAYYVNHPGVQFFADTNGYTGASANILEHGRFVSPLRLPGYPLLMSIVFVLAGRQNFAALSVAQGALFVLAVVQIYAITALIVRRGWVALVVGMLVGTNIYLLKYVRPIVADGTALWLVSTVALLAVIFVRWPRAWTLWALASATLALFMTRPEWIYLPVPLLATLLVVATRAGKLRDMLPHALAAVVVLNLALGVYAYRNAVDYGFDGITSVQNVNLLGKVLQYHMQNEAPPQYAAVEAALPFYLAHSPPGPWALVHSYSALGAHHGALAGAFATAIIQRHPIEFAAKTLLLLFGSLSPGWLNDNFVSITAIQPAGAFAGLLLALQRLSLVTVAGYLLFPVLALIWLARFSIRGGHDAVAASTSAAGARRVHVDAIGVVALIGFYALVVTALGTYSEYGRIHTSSDPLVIVVIGSSMYAGVAASVAAWRQRAARTAAAAR